MLKVEIADTPNKQQRGLMFRKHLPLYHGMLFKFQSSDFLRFWGLNTYIPLDVAFVDSNYRIQNIEEIKPMSLKTVASKKPCIMAIEANKDFFHDNNIKEGDQIIIDGYEVDFKEDDNEED